MKSLAMKPMSSNYGFLFLH